MEKLQRSSFKAKLPTPYQGQESLDDFELWDYEVDQWLEDTGFKGRTAVRHLGSFLRGKAARWFMDFVAPEPESYTMDTLKVALFQYCFKPDLREQLRRDFKFARQGNMCILDYIQSLKRLQRRIPDITEQQLCIKLWESVHVYLKMKWSDAGMTS
ncbi:hypothetical protein BDV93DRAFT_452832 [Ceratobasidium sp. AG-I]|nr:hypothetical protein BDV93DRAFT_452832 [Ceratobasidium sp. AG-I]